jgi:hypothetical protein
LVAVEHLAEFLAPAVGGLLGDTDAVGAAGEFDELVGTPQLLVRAVDDAKPRGSRASTGLFQFEKAGEDTAPLALDDDPILVVVLVEKERIDLRDLL